MFSVSRILLRSAVLAAVVTTATAAIADESVQKYRKSAYAAVGGHMTAAVAIVKGEVAFADDLAVHGQALADLAKITLHVFPEGSGGGESRALPAIWQKPAEFKKVQDDFVKAAAAFAVASKQGPKGAADALSSLGQTCKACHDNFRAEKK